MKIRVNRHHQIDWPTMKYTCRAETKKEGYRKALVRVVDEFFDFVYEQSDIRKRTIVEAAEEAVKSGNSHVEVPNEKQHLVFWAEGLNTKHPNVGGGSGRGSKGCRPNK